MTAPQLYVTLLPVIAEDKAMLAASVVVKQ